MKAGPRNASPNRVALTEYLAIAVGALITGAVLIAAWIIGPDVYTWLEEAGR